MATGFEFCTIRENEKMTLKQCEFGESAGGKNISCQKMFSETA